MTEPNEDTETLSRLLKNAHRNSPEEGTTEVQYRKLGGGGGDARTAAQTWGKDLAAAEPPRRGDGRPAAPVERKDREPAVDGVGWRYYNPGDFEVQDLPCDFGRSAISQRSVACM